MTSVPEIVEHYRYLKLDTKALITEAQSIRFLTGDPVELAAMLEIERHAEEILRMIEKMEERKEAMENDEIPGVPG